jgi:phage terminase large subunit-like protein
VKRVHCESLFSALINAKSTMASPVFESARAGKRFPQRQDVKKIPAKADWLEDEAFTYRQHDNLVDGTSSAHDRLRVAREYVIVVPWSAIE